MIKFVGNKDGKPLFGFGLSRGNMEKLLDGQPIAVELSQLGDYEGVVLIFGGETEEEMKEQLDRFGLIGPDTQIRQE